MGAARLPTCQACGLSACIEHCLAKGCPWDKCGSCKYYGPADASKTWVVDPKDRAKKKAGF